MILDISLEDALSVFIHFFSHFFASQSGQLNYISTFYVKVSLFMGQFSIFYSNSERLNDTVKKWLLKKGGETSLLSTKVDSQFLRQ